MRKNKIRVNITVDVNNLEKAKTKLKLFGGKLSTLFDAYLSDFVKSIDSTPSKTQEELLRRINILEKRMERLEER